MARCFVKEGPTYVVKPMDGKAYVWNGSLRPLGPEGYECGILLVRLGDPVGQEKWFALAPTPEPGNGRTPRPPTDSAGRQDAAPREVLVNGVPVVTGMRRLCDRDELRLAGRRERLFFSLESDGFAPSPFPIRDRRVTCPRCRIEIAPDSPAVRCPSSACTAPWHHHACWEYDAVCASCGRPTRPDADVSWVPAVVAEEWASVDEEAAPMGRGPGEAGASGLDLAETGPASRSKKGIAS